MLRSFSRLLLVAMSLALTLVAAAPGAAQELLTNRSYESPVAPNLGNNFYTSIPGWTILTVTPAQSMPWNLVRPSTSYAGNPSTPPTGGGVQYLDINSASATIRQSVTIPEAGVINFSGWFSVRDFPQALSGLNIRIRQSNGTIIATASTSFAASDPIGVWRLASGANISVSAGSYIFEVDIPNFANFDLASMVFTPFMKVTKTSAAYSDPANGLINPKMIPGGLVEYTITLDAPANGSFAGNSIVVTDMTPPGLQLVVRDFAASGTGPAAFNPGSSGLTYVFSGLSSTSDSIEFSNNNGLSWTYVPIVNANGTDPSVTGVRVRPQGSMTSGTSATLRMRYRVQ